MLASDWLAVPVPRPDAATRLVCLPSAGAGTSSFREWPGAVPATIEVALVRLPGREGRFREPLMDSMDHLVNALVEAIETDVYTRFALLGHSMGARVGFELARELRRRGSPGPEALYVACAAAPQLGRTMQLHDLPDDALLVQLRGFGGFPAPVLESMELLAALLPVLRADFKALETCLYSEEPPLPCPIRAFAGAQDPVVTVAAVEAWRHQTSADFALEVMPGGHFIDKARRTAIVKRIAEDLATR